MSKPDLNTFLNLNQALTLGQLQVSSQEQLKVQYANNTALLQIQSQLAQANETNSQILRNQQIEIQKKEEQKYFKNFLFKCNLLLKEVSPLNEEIIGYINDNYLKNLNTFLSNVSDKLDEIQDKEYCQSVISQVSAIINKGLPDCDTGSRIGRISCRLEIFLSNKRI